jgi:hypothetical protein
MLTSSRPLRDAGRALELLDGLRQGRLRHVQSLGCASEVKLVGQDDEAPDVPYPTFVSVTNGSCSNRYFRSRALGGMVPAASVTGGDA